MSAGSCHERRAKGSDAGVAGGEGGKEAEQSRFVPSGTLHKAEWCLHIVCARVVCVCARA